MNSLRILPVSLFLVLFSVLPLRSQIVVLDREEMEQLASELEVSAPEVTDAPDSVAKFPVGNLRVPADTISGLEGRYFIRAFVPYFGDNYIEDTVSVAYARQYLQIEPEVWTIDAISLHTDYYKLFVPFTFYRSAMGEYSTLKPQPRILPDRLGEMAERYLPLDTLSLGATRRHHSQVNRMLMSAYLREFDRVVFWDDYLGSVQAFSEDIQSEKKIQSQSSKSNILSIFAMENQLQDVTEEAGVDIHKPSWWSFSGNGSAQLSQNYISENWYKGGQSNNTLLTTLTLGANYNDREKIQWENLLDARLGFASTTSDKFHKYLANSNQLRFYTKLGVQATKHWYYTVSAEFKTQMVTGYNANSDVAVSAFMAPADLTTSVGLDFKKQIKKYSFSIFLAPLTYTMRYVDSRKVNPVSLGLMEGHEFRHNFGSQIQPTFSWKLSASITLDSRLNYLTSYEWVRVEWENTLNFILNRYLSTKLYVFARYDDSTAPTKGTSHFQVNEILSFGVNYNW